MIGSQDSEVAYNPHRDDLCPQTSLTPLLAPLFSRFLSIMLLIHVSSMSTGFTASGQVDIEKGDGVAETSRTSVSSS